MSIRMEGARLTANSKASLARIEWILREPLPKSLESSFVTLAVNLLLLLTTPIFAVETHAATLKSETVAAWDDYLQTANVDLQDRVLPGGSFLSTLEDAGRADRVRRGEIVVVPAFGQNPKKVPGGLIHHWVGAMFLPNLKLDDILEVTRDYDHYKEFYSPSVTESKMIARSDSEDKFSMLLINKALFLKTALDTDCLVTNVRLDERRYYGISRTTRVQEVEEYGQPSEYRKAEGEGRGLIWKLYSIARLEQRDGGVYIELEAIALSRDIPSAVRLVVAPVVRRVSRNALLISLQQTEKAVGGRVAGVASAAGAPASAGKMRSGPTSPSRVR
jgi:hypothetical protein